MDSNVLIALIGAVPATMSVFVAGFGVWMSWSARESAKEAKFAAREAHEVGTANHNKLNEVSKTIDGLTTARVDAAGQAGHAVGIAEERQVSAKRAADTAVATAVVTADHAAVEVAAAEARQPGNGQEKGQAE